MLRTVYQSMFIGLTLFTISFLDINFLTETVQAQDIAGQVVLAEVDSPTTTPREQAAAVLGFLAFGTFWFWASIVAFLIIIFGCIENESGVSATIALVIYGCILQWLSNVDIIGFLFENPIRIGVITLSYIGIGIVWSAFKFWWYMGNEVQKIKKEEEDWTIRDLRGRYQQQGKRYEEAEQLARNEYKASGMPATLYDKWNEYVDENSPKVSKNKGMIMRAIGYWPISMVCFFITDFVTEVFCKIYYRLSDVYEHIAESVKNSAKKK